MRSQNCRRDSGSTPPVGSSRNTMGGWWRMAQPSASRWRQPPARSRVRVCSRPSRPAISRTNARRSLEGVAVAVLDAAEEPDVLIDGQRLVEREALRHVADAALDCLGIARDVDAADDGRAGGRPQQTAQHADGGRLAGAVGAEKAEDLAGFDVERQLIDGRERAEPARELVDLDAQATSSPQRAIEPRFREPDVGERARAIELGLQQRHLRVEHLGAGRDADVESLGHDTPGFGGAAHRRRRRRPARRARNRCRAAAGARRWRSASRARPAAPAAAVAARRGFGRFGGDAAAVPQRPVRTFTQPPTTRATSSSRGKMRGLGLA